MQTPKPKQKRKRRIPATDRKERQVVVRMTDTEYDHLEAMAKRENLPVAYFIREAIQLLIEKKGK